MNNQNMLKKDIKALLGYAFNFKNSSGWIFFTVVAIVLYLALSALLAPDNIKLEYILQANKENKKISLSLNEYTTFSRDFYVEIDKKVFYLVVFLQDISDTQNKLKAIGLNLPQEPIGWKQKVKFNHYLDSLFYLIIVMGLITAQKIYYKVRTSRKMFLLEKVNVKFSDVAGIDLIRGELEEVIEHFKDGRRIKNFGGKLLKGVMLYGPPGTGKTLMAKAVAGETNSNFIALSGSNVVELYVGMGARRIREVFENARKHKPCVVFIDEIDAFAKKRGSEHSHSEYDQTVNELLTQMDGFQDNSDILIIAATNRLDSIDDALLRPGRFDRKVEVSLPSVKGRKEILKLYVDKIPNKDEDIDLDKLAQSTTYFSGAELKNLVDEAIYLAIKKNKKSVSFKDFLEAKDKITLGVKKDLTLTYAEKLRTAYHEIGHLLIAHLLKCGNLDQVTILPRRNALGVTVVNSGEKTSYTQKELLSRIKMMLGGRCAEKIIYNDLTTGAMDDIDKATSLVKQMICNFGMGSLGSVNLNHIVSQDTAREVDQEIIKTIKTCEEETMALLKANEDTFKRLTELLVEKETLYSHDLDAFFKSEGV